MKESVWLYMWLLDKITSVNEEGEGKILGGKPINYKDIDLGISRDIYVDWVNKLRAGGYITTLRTPRGLIITIHKTFKYFNQKNDVPNTHITTSKKKSDVPKSPSDVPNTHMQYKTKQDKDNIPTGSWTKKILQKYEEYRKVKLGNVSRQCQSLGTLKKIGLSPDDIWVKLLALERSSDFWQDNPPDFINLANNIHKIKPSLPPSKSFNQPKP